MKIPEFDDYEDNDLNDLAQAVSAEQIRRADLKRIPALMVDAAKQYTNGGGDVQDLISAITPVVEESDPEITE